MRRRDRQSPDRHVIMLCTARGQRIIDGDDFQSPCILSWSVYGDVFIILERVYHTIVRRFSGQLTVTREYEY